MCAMRRRATLRDVAKAAGVSKSTVSRALLGGRTGVSEQTRRKVLESCKRIGYQPNASARALKTGGKNRIAVIIESIRAPWGTEIVYGINKALASSGYDLLLLLMDGRNESNLVDVVSAGQFGGVIYVGGDRVREVDLPVDEWMNLPCVCAYSICDKVPSVIPDDRQGGYLATLALVQRGHRSIAVVMGPESWTPCQERVAGYREALGELGEEIVVFGRWTFNDGYRHASEILKSHPEVTAFFGGDDHIAAGLMSAAFDAGRVIPDTLAIVGFDDIDLTRHIKPNLASVRMPLQEIGEAAATILMRMLWPNNDRSAAEPRIIRIGCKLIERESIGSRAR